jgi:hypothetical protein
MELHHPRDPILMKKRNPAFFHFFQQSIQYVYGMNYLKGLDVPKIIYKSVGKYDESELVRFIGTGSHDDKFSVFVGAASSNQTGQSINQMNIWRYLTRTKDL